MAWLVSKRVTGGLTVTATLRASRASAPADPPAQAIVLVGLMARDPAGDGGDSTLSKRQV